MASPATERASEAASTLLSLSMVAKGATPIPIVTRRSSRQGFSLGGLQSSVGYAGSSHGSGGKQHRRLSSSGRVKRRLSDAHDATNRPSPATLSFNSLSLSSSLPLVANSQSSTSFVASTHPVREASISDGQRSSETEDENKIVPVPFVNGKSGKKRGLDYKCESCSKIYRHPSCLIKHRWEHTPYWREASKFGLSKHQQVQLLEAAAILSHLSPSSCSLPEDRSLWPSFLSGGSLPKAEDTTSPAYLVSTSVPTTGKFIRSSSSGPRLHSYRVPSSATAAGCITELRPGLLGVPTAASPSPEASSGPLPVPRESSSGCRSTAGTSTSLTSSMSVTPSSCVSDSASLSLYSDERSGDRCKFRRVDDLSWSLPHSSARGSSSGSRSRSRSGSSCGSLDREQEVVDDRNGSVSRGTYSVLEYPGRYSQGSWKKEEEEIRVEFRVRDEDEDSKERGIAKREQEWDDLDMDMDMD